MPHKFIIAILTCEKNKDRLEAVRETWVKDLTENFKVFYVFARPGEKTELRGSNLYLDCADNYENIPGKIISLYNFLIANFDFDYIYKCDDDTYVNIQALLELDLEDKDYVGNFVKNEETTIDRTAHYGKCADKSLEVPYRGEFITPWARGGRGYFLSKRATIELCKLATHQDISDLFEDKMVADILSRADNIKTLHLKKNEMPSLHPIQASEMYLIHGLYKSKRKLLEETPTLRGKLLRLEMTTKELKEKSFLLKDSNDELIAKNKTLLADMSLLKAQKREFADRNLQLKSELSSIRERIQEQRIQKSQLQERNEVLVEKNKTISESLALLKVKKNELDDKNKHLENEQITLKKQLQDLKAQKSLLHERSEVLSEKNKTSLETLSRLKAQKQELSDKNTQLKEALLLTKEQIHELKTKKNNLLEKNKKLVSDKLALEAELAEIKQSAFYKFGKLFKK